uniref:Cullin-4 n=1 Tax=Rhizophora mucronata TaxID=61149 RepID=A0A2P2JD82_RHIMU
MHQGRLDIFHAPHATLPTKMPPTFSGVNILSRRKNHSYSH